jgi:predicted  nucleic acid-binding Zn-ribbon protein
MDILMTVVFAIMFLIIIGVTIYLIYDYMGYKDNVDTAFEISTNYINDTFEKVSDNIDATAEDLSKGINNNTKNITTLNVRTDGVVTKTQLIEDEANNLRSSVGIMQDNVSNLSSNISREARKTAALQGSIQNIHNHVSNIYGNIHNMSSNITNVSSRYGTLNHSVQNARTDISNIQNNVNQINYDMTNESAKVGVLETSVQNVESNVSKSQERINKVSNKMNQFDTALKKYFKFSEDNVGIDNDKIFQHTFSGINPNLQLLTEVDAVSGLTVKTSGNQSFKVCNAENNCMSMNVENDRFNITPINVNNLTINSRNNSTLANFDLQTNSIYLGGSDMNAPMFIQDSNLYVNNMSVLIKEPGKTYTNNDLQSVRKFKITGEEIYDVGRLIHDTLEEYAVRIDYSLVNATETTLEQSASQSSPSYIINTLSMRIQSGADLRKNDYILYAIPSSVYGTFTGYNEDGTAKIYTLENVMTDNVDTTKSIVESSNDSLMLKIVINKNIAKNTEILLQLYGIDIFSYKNLIPKNGNVNGAITRA